MVNLWDSIVSMMYQAITSVFGWFDQLIDNIPGSWATVLTFFVFLAVTRFILGSLVGTGFAGGGIIGFIQGRSSDKARSRSRSNSSSNSNSSEK